MKGRARRGVCPFGYADYSLRKRFYAEKFAEIQHKYEADPYRDAGIEEAEITTVLLSEAATAKEAVALLLNIYDTVGCAGGASAGSLRHVCGDADERGCGGCDGGAGGNRSQCSAGTEGA